MSKRIRVDEDTHAALVALKGEDEPFDDRLSWLIQQRREAIRKGAGLCTAPTLQTLPETNAES